MMAASRFDSRQQIDEKGFFEVGFAHLYYALVGISQHVVRTFLINNIIFKPL